MAEEITTTKTGPTGLTNKCRPRTPEPQGTDAIEVGFSHLGFRSAWSEQSDNCRHDMSENQEKCRYGERLGGGELMARRQ